MQIQTNASLRQYHTFAIEQPSELLVTVESIDDIKQVYLKTDWLDLPKLMLGCGSNMLFTAPYRGVAIINRLKGIDVRESEEHWHLDVAGGEDWPRLVQWTVEKGLNGLENLALIPGCVGSAPIQNIGAYGLELKDVCEYVDVLELESFEVKRLSAIECQFGYRDSIFKHALFEKVIIVAVGLKLAKDWQPNLAYGPLQSFSAETVKAKEIFDQVCQVRMEKLPDPAQIGNAGSFFKNPVISAQQFSELQSQYPSIVGYSLGSEADSPVKLAAGWLIDQCGLKGHQIGGAMVHPNQALVLVNADNASAQDVISLADFVRQSVWQKYHVALEHEVRFMGETAETNLNQLLGELE